MNTKTTEVTATLKDGEQLKVVNAPKEQKPIFHMVGTGKKRKGVKVDPVNFIDELTSMSKPEHFVIKTIIEALGFNDNIGEVHIPTSMFNNSELQKWKKGLPILKNKKLMCSTKRSHFMINPNALIPKEYDEALKIWYTKYPYPYSDFKL
jgi:hypothetical protein